jgi:hypothetical protein
VINETASSHQSDGFVKLASPRIVLGKHQSGIGQV